MPGTELILPDDNGRLELPEARTPGAIELWKRADRLAACRPFARFACDPPCSCHNCKARTTIASVEAQQRMQAKESEVADADD